MTAAAGTSLAPDPAAGTAGRRRRWPRILAIVLLLAFLAVVLVGAWWLQPQPLLPEATAALASTDAVSVTDEGGILTFTPTGAEPTVGFIFYPGGKVEPAAYARSAQAIAAEGYLVAIPGMPLNLAVLGADRATEVMEANAGIGSWVLGGHSLGGAMAGQYADAHPDTVDGLALWAAWPNGDLSDQPDLDVAVIYGTLDSGAPRMTSDETRATLPADARYVPIEGGNHEQMGDYTGQPGDPPATISREEQQAQAVAATLDVLSAQGPPAGG